MTRLYYLIKPVIPRRLQISLRQFIARKKREKYANIWPIVQSSSKKPGQWKGWPNNKKFALVLTHDIEHQKGYDKVLDLMQIEKDLGFIGSYNFIPERDYKIKKSLFDTLRLNGFEIGVHGLYHDGKLYSSRKEFIRRAEKINYYLEEWKCKGFRSPAMHHNLEWLLDLNIEYDLSTFDTDPFEPQPDGVGTIFPFWVYGINGKRYLEIPYTIPQDSTVFILLGEKDTKIWKEKLDWIVKHGGMALLNTHPDYIAFNNKKEFEKYSLRHYIDFLKYIKSNYENQYWNALPQTLCKYFNEIR